MPDADAGAGSMDVVAQSGVGHLDACIVDAVASLRDAGATDLLAEVYDRYTGEREFVDGLLVAEDPEDTADTAVQEIALYVTVVDGRTWSSFQQADFTWGWSVASRGWDTRKVSVIGYARPQCAEVVCSRYMERSRCLYQIPSVQCDRTFSLHPRDRVYMKEMVMWLFGGRVMPLLMTD